MFIETVKIQSLSNNSYVVGSEHSGQCAVIDPARDIDQYTNIASSHGVRIVYALETHLHNDFISGARELAAQTGCQVGSSASGGLLYPSVRLQDDDTFDLGEFRLRILHTPGHTPGSQCFLVDGRLVAGDTLFLEGCGRTDLPGGDPAALYHSLHHRLSRVPDEAVLYPGHLYSPQPSAPMGETRRDNFVFKPRSEEQWLTMFGR